MVFVYKPSENILKRMIKYYTPYKKEINPPYSILQANVSGTIITIYESGKVMFQGISADIDANLWKEMEKKLNNRDLSLEDKNKTKDKEKIEYTFQKISSVGSDEVGTGDFFGPIVVTATYVDKKQIPFMEELGVNDSKKINDENIKKIAPELIKTIPYVSFILSNEEYNQLTNSNMNQIKAILHNKVLLKLIKDNNLNPEKIVIDQFVYPKKYYEHLKEAKEVLKGITFVTKAESQYYSVAAASIISRYLFLNEMNKINTKYDLNIPFGAGSNVDNYAKEIIKTKGKDILPLITKVNFKNTNKILDNI